MGTDGGRFDVSDRLTADRLNRKTVLVDTGVNIGAAMTMPCMLAFCTSSESGFSAGQMYQRNEDNTAWYQIINGSSGQTLGSKTIEVDNNTIKDSTTNNTGDILINNGTKFVRKARGAARRVPQVNSGGSDLVFGLLSGGSMASDSRRPDMTVGTQSGGNAGTSNTNWSSAIGQIAHNVRNTSNKIIVIVTGNISNAAQNGSQRNHFYPIFVDGNEQSSVTRSYQTSTWMTNGGSAFPFFIILVMMGLSAGNHTFDLRVHNNQSASDSNATVAEVLVAVLKFGGSD